MSYSTIQMLEIQGFTSYNKHSAESWQSVTAVPELLYERSHFNHGIY